MALKKKLGKLLQSKRRSAGLTQGEIAKVLGYSSPQFISNFERGLCLPSIESLPILTKVYKIRPKVMIEILMDIEKKRLLKIFKGLD